MFLPGRIRFAIVQTVLLASIAASCLLAEVKHKMYVPHPFTSEDGRSMMSVYDLEERRLISTVQTVPSATFARLTPDGKRIWVFSSRGKDVEVYDVATDELVSTPFLDAPACDAVFDPGGAICYVAHGSFTEAGDNAISYVDVETQVATYAIATGDNPVSLAIQKDGSRLYVANQGDNSITVIDPSEYRITGTLYAGIEPRRLLLSNAGQYLFVANRGVDLGRKGGSCVTVIETESGSVVRVIETGNGPSSLGLTPDGARLVVCHLDHSYFRNLWFFDMTYESGEVEVEVAKRITSGKGVEFGAVDPTGGLFVVPDHIDGGVYVLDMLRPRVVSKIENLYGEKAYFVEFASVNIEDELAIRDSIIRIDPSSLEAQKAAFERAYLYRTAGDQNAVVTAYTSIVDRYPGTISEATALFELGDLCYHQDLVSNSADYYNRGLHAFGRLLEAGVDKDALESGVLLDAAERLGELAIALNENYFVDLYKLYVNIPIMLREFPQLFFTFGVSLRKLGDTRFASKCFDETENRLIELMDESLYQEMKFKIKLVRSDSKAMFSASKIKGTITLDGRLDEWDTGEILSLNRRDNVVVNQMRWLDGSDISGSFHVGYDQYNLYIAGDIADDKVFRESPADGDYIGIYLDLRDGSGNYMTRNKEFGDGVYSIRVIPIPETPGTFRVESDHEMQPMIGGAVSSAGYVFELKIPFAYLGGFNPKERERIGFGMELFDLDSGSSSDPPKVVGWLMPTRSAYGPRFTELFGILEF